MNRSDSRASTVDHMPVLPPDGRSLVGTTVRLDPLTLDDAAELLPCFADPRVYAERMFVMHRPPADLDGMRALMSARLQPGKVPYTVRVDGVVVGTSSLMDVDLVNERTHIGSTLYHPDHWGTAVNPETKLLLLGHAFDDCGFGRVKIQTDALNTRSTAAIAKLGATREGTLRRHMRREDGTFRDTVVFSILRDEWPAVREQLLRRIARVRA
jgi:RimJ/RimL family protein N-acetyltransferase